MAKNGTPDLFWGGVVVVDWIPIIISPDMAKTVKEQHYSNKCSTAVFVTTTYLTHLKCSRTM